GSRVAEIRPGTGVPQNARPTANASTDTAAAPTTHASWRRTCPSEERQRATSATTQSSWKPAYAGCAIADHSEETASGTSSVNGWVVCTPAEAYSTGQSADSVAHTSVIATIRAATHRHRGEGSRPSGKQTTAKVVR